MATLVAPLETRHRTERAPREQDRRFGLVLTGALTLQALAVHGYHPYAEDGGLYVAGVKRLLDPTLYPHSTAFVLAPMRISLFAPLVAGLVHLSHLSLPTVLLTLHVASIWATLFAAWMLAGRCWAQREARAGAVVLLACWLTLPVAGTALFLMDPYVTARSLSTPCTLFALAAALDVTGRSGESRRLGAFLVLCGCLGFAAAMHPLMATYATWAVLMLACIRLRSVWGAVTLSVATLAVAGCVQHFATPASPEYIRIALTRTYWFPSLWAWYELLGLVAPLAILAAFAWAKSRELSPQQALARMAVAVGLTASAAALLFARAGGTTHMVARLQPLRAFQIVYLIMVPAIGAKLGEAALRRSAWRWCTVIALLGSIMCATQRAEFPNTNHVELPSQTPRNLWAQAFLWVRDNTPKDALFALDADYISGSGEDAQSFRAIAERSALPDYSKDGGEASIAPELTAEWTTGEAAQQHLSAPQTTDAQRIANLRSLGVTWLVLKAAAQTNFNCPYRNAAAKVCRLP